MPMGLTGLSWNLESLCHCYASIIFIENVMLWFPHVNPKKGYWWYNQADIIHDEQTTPDPQPQENVQKSESSISKAEPVKQAATATPIVSPPRVDYATDLFRMLSVKDSRENDSEISAANGVSTGFQCMFLSLIFLLSNYCYFYAFLIPSFWGRFFII